MLRTLFEAAEGQGGERLETFASLAYALGALFIAWRALAPLLGGVFEAAAAGAGVHRGFTVICEACQARSLLGAKCEKCGADLKLSLPVRAWARLNSPGRLRRSSVSFGVGVLASSVFVAATAVATLSLHALSPHGTLERLFLGIAAVAWAGGAFLLSRTFSLTGIGPLTRARELLFGSGALGIALLAAVLAQLARPQEAKALATLTADEGSVHVNGQKLPIDNGEVALAYQVIESPALGLTMAVPLSLNGSAGNTVPLEHEAIEGWLLNATWQRAEALNSRGFAVKRRSEQFRVSPGHFYEVRLGEREPTLALLKN
jgi:hypothetical protein